MILNHCEGIVVSCQVMVTLSCPVTVRTFKIITLLCAYLTPLDHFVDWMIVKTLFCHCQVIWRYPIIVRKLNTTVMTLWGHLTLRCHCNNQDIVRTLDTNLTLWGHSTLTCNCEDQDIVRTLDTNLSLWGCFVSHNFDDWMLLYNTSYSIFGHSSSFFGYTGFCHNSVRWLDTILLFWGLLIILCHWDVYQVVSNVIKKKKEKRIM